MTPRPKTVPDHDVFAATSRVIGRVGPARLTLARIAEEAGLAPATLVQRYGSKRGLLLALGRQAEGDDGAAELARLRRRHPSPLAALREFLLCFARMAATADELANHLAAFQADIVDPELRRITRALGQQHQRTVRTLLAEAVAGGELHGCDPDRLAPVLLAVAQGSLLAWAIERQGTARRFVARHLDTTLQPYGGGTRPAPRSRR